MKQSVHISKSGNAKEALQHIINPSLLMFMTTKENISKHAEAIRKMFPDVPSMGCVGDSYSGTEIYNSLLMIVAYSDGIDVQANVITDVNKCPARHMKKIYEDSNKVNAGISDTVCIDFCTGNDEVVITTLNAVLEKKQIPLIGGTAGDGLVAYNGRVYENACVYALIKNKGGKVKVYRENMYKPMKNSPKLIVTDADPENDILYKLNNKPAQIVYQNLLGIQEKDITNQTFTNPFGRICGNEVFIISIKGVEKNQGLSCYHRTSKTDVLTLLELDDYDRVVSETVSKIQSDFRHVSAIFSVNCAFRYLFFNERGYWGEYLRKMSIAGPHTGFVGFGEHYCNQFTNQTFSCVVFE